MARSAHSPAACSPIPPPPIFVAMAFIGPNVNWFGESILLASAAVNGRVEEAREIIARHDPGIAQWVPDCVHDGLFMAAIKGNAELIDMLGPFADIEDFKAMQRIVAGAAHGGDEQTLEKVIQHCVYARLKLPELARE